jgi:hypothetical protein
MTTITLTPELGAAVKQAVERSGGRPVRVEGPCNHCPYHLVQGTDAQRVQPDAGPSASQFSLPEGVRRS